MRDAELLHTLVLNTVELHTLELHTLELHTLELHTLALHTLELHKLERHTLVLLTHRGSVQQGCSTSQLLSLSMIFVTHACLLPPNGFTAAGSYDCWLVTAYEWHIHFLLEITLKHICAWILDYNYYYYEL